MILIHCSNVLKSQDTLTKYMMMKAEVTSLEAITLENMLHPHLHKIRSLRVLLNFSMIPLYSISAKVAP
jgi:hypothetical protein